MQIKTEEYTTTVEINLVCPDCGKMPAFVNHPEHYAETFVNTDEMVVVSWHCNYCGSGGVLHLFNRPTLHAPDKSGYVPFERHYPRSPLLPVMLAVRPLTAKCERKGKHGRPAYLSPF